MIINDVDDDIINKSIDTADEKSSPDSFGMDDPPMDGPSTSFDGMVELTLIDTAGIRRRGDHKSDIERATLMRCIRAMRRADVTILVANAMDGITQQDKSIAEQILQTKSGVLLAVNQWDRMREKRPVYKSYARKHLQFMKYVPIVFCSAKTGMAIDSLIDEAIRTYQQRRHRFKTRELIALAKRAALLHPPPRKGRRQCKIKHVTQAKASVPTFVFHVTHPHLIHFTYTRYMENVIRQYFPYTGTPINILWKKSAGRRARNRRR